MPIRRPRPRLAPRKRKNELTFHRGHKIPVPNHPTDFCAQPWYPLTVRLVDPGNITLGSLYVQLAAQLSGISFVGSLANVRIMAIRVWGPIPTTNAALSVKFHDVFDDLIGATPLGSQTILEVVENYADQVNRARVGYIFSTAQQQKSVLISSGAPDIIATITGGGTGALAYVQLLWRPFPIPARKQREVSKPTAKVSNDLANLTIS
jgi:hypothetical protein